MSYNKDEVKELIDMEDVYNLLEYFHAEPQMFNNHIVAKTICHGGNSNKLYYYENSGLCYCYTHCGYFDVFELVLKVLSLDNLNQAVYWLVNFLNIDHKLEDSERIDSDDWAIFNKYNNLKELKPTEYKELEYEIYDPKILKYYPQPEILNWSVEGISKEVCDYMNIRYDPLGGNILIPHYNRYGELIGIRQRTLLKEEEKFGKYRPWKQGHKMYNHPLGFNIYGLDKAQQNIKDLGIAVVVESEKAVLQYMSYFGTAANVCVAVCGSSISKYQFELLKQAGMKEMVVAFDKDYESLDSLDYQKVEEHLLKIYNKYSADVNVSFLLDVENKILGFHSSPLDCGKDAFLYLFRNRIIL